jgi:hypothetical protein
MTAPHAQLPTIELVALVLGVGLLVVLLAALVAWPAPTPTQCGILRFFRALDAALLTYFVSGRIRLKGMIRRITLSASGGFVLFLLIMFATDFCASPPAFGAIRILLPSHEAKVHRTVGIEWVTSYPDKNHYVLAGWEGAPTPFVQDPTLVTAGSTWKGFAQLGEAGDPPGSRFYLQIIATRSRLKEGPLGEPPEDALYSDRILVTTQ